MIGKAKIAGIGLTEEDAELRYSATIKTSKMELAALSAGKLFCGLEIIKQGSVALGLFINGEEYKWDGYKKHGGKNLIKPVGEIEAESFELPMRIIEAKKEYQIIIRTGYFDNEQPVWTDASEFTLIITSESPTVKYDKKKDSD